MYLTSVIDNRTRVQDLKWFRCQDKLLMDYFYSVTFQPLRPNNPIIKIHLLYCGGSGLAVRSTVRGIRYEPSNKDPCASGVLTVSNFVVVHADLVLARIPAGSNSIRPIAVEGSVRPLYERRNESFDDENVSITYVRTIGRVRSRFKTSHSKNRYPQSTTRAQPLLDYSYLSNLADRYFSPCYRSI